MSTDLQACPIELTNVPDCWHSSHVRVALVAVCISAVTVGHAVASTLRAPALRIVDDAPVVVRGTGFYPLERVRVTLTRNGRVTTRQARATSAGTFRAGFGLIALDPCVGFVVVRATGARGSRAVARRVCRGPAP